MFNPIFFITLGVLLVSCYYDLRTRVIPDRVWLIGIPIVFYLRLVCVGYDFLDLLFASSVVILLLFAYYFLGLGGADVKAYALISLAFPRIAIFVLIGALVSSLLGTLLYVLFKNLKNKNWHLGKYFFMGYEVPVEDVSPRDHLLLEYIDEKGRVVRRPLGFCLDEISFEKIRCLRRKVLVTPSIPFTLPTTVSFMTLGWLYSIYIY